MGSTLDRPRREIVAEALQHRLTDVRRAIESSSATYSPPPPPEDPEEALRVVMVRLWPAACRPDAPWEARSVLLTRLVELEGPARGDDWRFLDAWNNVYETAVDRRWLDDRDLVDPFLLRYAGLLETHLKRLSPNDAQDVRPL
jgi:hypothetical protein